MTSVQKMLGFVEVLAKSLERMQRAEACQCKLLLVLTKGWGGKMTDTIHNMAR